MLMALLAGSALAAVPFALPPGEREVDWSEPLALAGFSPGEGDCPAVDVAESGEQWKVITCDRAGVSRELWTPRPQD